MSHRAARSSGKWTLVISASALLASLCSSHRLVASTYTWDADGVAPQDGGSGTWDTSSLLWFNSTTTAYSAWNTGNVGALSTAFGGTGGTVTIANGAILAVGSSTISFTATGYDVQSAGTGVLNIQSGTLTVS